MTATLFDTSHIFTAIVSLLGVILLYAALAGFAAVKEMILKKAVLSFKSSSLLTRDAVRMTRQIEMLLRRLRDRYDAARVAVFQFHDGAVFMLADHSWKVTCTHEVVADGVTHTLKENQGLLVSQLIDWLDPILTGEIERTAGAALASVCACVTDPNDPTECPMDLSTSGKKAIRYIASEMEPSVSKYMAHEQGVGIAYCVPLMVGMDAGEGDTFGFISLQFRNLSDSEAVDFENSGGPCAICRIAKEIQFLLHNQFKKRK